MSSENVPPGPSGLPLLGSTHKYFSSPLSFYEDCADEYGDVVSFTVGGNEMVLVSDPELVETVLVRREDKLGKPDFFQDLLGGVFGRGLLTNEGDDWQTQRQMLQPLFFRERMAEYIGIITEYADDHIRQWDDGSVHEIHGELGSLTLRIITDIVLGIDLEEHGVDLRGDIENLYDRYLPQNQLVPEWVPTRDNREYKSSLSRLNELVYERIETHRQRGTDDNSMLSMVMDAGAKSDRDLSNKQIRDEVVTMILGGHETTTALLTFGLYALADRPQLQDSVRDEAESILSGGQPTLEDVSAFDKVERAVKETMRLYPPSPVVLRSLRDDLRVGGYHLPEGATAMFPQWVVHHDDRFYDDPWEFDIDRWGGEAEEDRPRYAYFPFGGGSRRCIGHSFAKVEAKLLLATFLDRCEFTLRTDELDLQGSMTLQPANDVYLGIEKR